MSLRLRKYGRILTIGLIALLSCDGAENAGNTMNRYDQGALLQNLGSNIILASYEKLMNETQLLTAQVEEFAEGPSMTTLEDLRMQLKSTRISWQYCSPFNFGPAESMGLASKLNIYPIDTRQIESNIIAGNYDLNVLANNDARGFQTLGYLLYGDSQNDSEILSGFDDHRLQYLKDVTNLINETVIAVHNDWMERYLEVFTDEESEGIDVGSSLALFVNAMNQDFERNTRDGKIGIPVGIRTLGEPVPEATEAYFAGYSLELLEENLVAYDLLFTGGTGEGLDDYLNTIRAVASQETDLSIAVQSQLEKILMLTQELDDPLTARIIDKKTDIETVFVEMQQLVVLWKTEMASALGVTIAYQDNDGD